MTNGCVLISAKELYGKYFHFQREDSKMFKSLSEETHGFIQILFYRILFM